jgi:4-hydroxythreonine-4-phosphate dehydrogenase
MVVKALKPPILASRAAYNPPMDRTDRPASAPRPPLALSMGDACGIGPEIVLKAFLARGGLAPHAPRTPWVVYGDPGVLTRCARALALPVRIVPVTDPLTDAPPHDGDTLVRVPVLACSDLPADLPPGHIDARAGRAAHDAIAAAATAAIAGRVRALVTAPIHKEAFAAAGVAYPGHTELLAALAGGADVRMMLANDELRTVLVTIHLPLRAAIDAVTQAAVHDTIAITHTALRRLGIERPRIAVAGLNPHAGEGGLMGREEIERIAPAIATARAAGIDASGPWPGDTVFMRARGFREFDVVVAMYHDQGLIPVKYLGLDAGVNVTIGLPFVRTSVDHGTAFDIAGRGLADPGSLLAAVALAETLTPASP